MDTVLVGPEIEENLSLRYLVSALERAGHRVDVVPFNRGADCERASAAILRMHPDLVGLSLVAQRRYADYQRLIERLRARGFRGHITAGGHFASLRAQEVMADTPGLDSILHHEGEVRLVQLADWLDESKPRTGATSGAPPSKLNGITWRGVGGRVEHRPPIEVANLDTLAPPRRRRPDRTLGLARAPIVASRGCAGDCSFCSIRAWHSQVKKARLRLRSARSVAEEMIGLHRDSGVRVFVFHDDDFLLPDPRKALERCQEILETARQGIGERFAFVLKCRPDDVDRDLFAYLGSMGLVRAYVGIETHAPSGLVTLNRRVTQGENERALAIFDQLGLYACFNLLLFDPDTTTASFAENLAFLDTQIARPFDVARTELYAGAALEERMRREGRARGDYRGFDYTIGDPGIEATFQLFADVLWERHFGADSILHRAQDLGYRLSLFRWIHPGAAPSLLGAEIATLIREVNLNTISYLRRLADFASRRDSPSARERFVRSMRQEVARTGRSHAQRYHLLSVELESRAALARSRAARWPGIAGIPLLLRRVAASVPYAAMALSAAACGDETTVCDPPPPPIRFRVDIEPVLDQTCAIAGCHDAATASAGLSLESGQSYEQLVGVPSSELQSMKRIEPGDVSQSYLVHKLRGTQLTVGGSGERMPKDRPAVPELARTVEEWIEGGATRD